MMETILFNFIIVIIIIAIFMKDRGRLDVANWSFHIQQHSIFA